MSYRPILNTIAAPGVCTQAVDRLERECAAALALLEVLRRRPALWWLADATGARLARLGASLDSARRGWPPG